MGQYKVSKAGNFFGGCSGHLDAIRALAQTQARILLAGNLPVVDNSGGVVSIANAIVFPNPVFDAPANGNDRATGANVDAALAALQGDLATLFSIATKAATIIGCESAIYNGGGAVSNNGTLAAINTAIAGAAVGPSAASLTAIMAGYNLAFYDLAVMVKKVQVAAGVNELVISPISGGAITYGLGPNFGAQVPVQTQNNVPPQSNTTYGRGPNFPGTGYTLAPRDTVPALVVASGPTNATGVSAVAMNAVLSLYATNLATLAAGLSAANLPGILGLRATS